MNSLPLAICQYCYDSKIKVPNSGGMSNKYDESKKGYLEREINFVMK